MTAGEYVFRGRKKGTHLVESKFTVSEVTKQSKVPFMVHDCRRSFLTFADSLDLPHSVLKRLANHRNKDVTEGYIPKNPERLREPMQRITDFVLTKAGLKPKAIDELTPVDA